MQESPKEGEVARRPTASTESSIDLEDPQARSRFSINGERLAELIKLESAVQLAAK
jgi:hypothetical protein